MSYYPQNAAGLNYIGYPVGPSATTVSLTAGASANAKGSYVQVVASLPWTANAAIASALGGTAAQGLAYLWDVATGASASEVAVVPNIPTDISNAGFVFYGQGSWPFNLAVASGTRIAARCQCSTGSETLSVALSLSAAGGVAGIASFANYGALTAGSQATSVDPGATANTKGAYVQMAASSAGVTQSLVLCLTGLADTSPTSALFCTDAATGAAASEVVLIPDVHWCDRDGSGGSGIVAWNTRSQSFLTYIAAGTRLSVRASSSINTSPARLIGIAVLAGTAPAESSGGETSVVFG